MNASASPASIDLQQILRDAEVQPVIDQLENELVGLAPVKARIREIAAFLVVSRARAAMAASSGALGRPSNQSVRARRAKQRATHTQRRSRPRRVVRGRSQQAGTRGAAARRV